MGITFKEDVSDIRNSRVIDIINELKEYGINVIICDPLADNDAVKHEYGVELTEYNPDIKADAVVIAVAHDIFKRNLTLDALKSHLTGHSHESGNPVTCVLARSEATKQSNTQYAIRNTHQAL